MEDGIFLQHNYPIHTLSAPQMTKRQINLTNLQSGQCLCYLLFDTMSLAEHAVRACRNDLKFSDRKVWTNSADLDQTAPLCS